MMWQAGDQVQVVLPDYIRLYCPSLTEKMLVDYANGLQVARGKINFQKDHSGALSRAWGSINGSSARRQQQVNGHLADGLEASLEWLTQLTEHLAQTDLAVAALGQCIEKIAGKISQTRAAMVALSKAHDTLEARFQELNAEVERLSFKDRVEEQLDLVFTRWEAGRFLSVSPLSRPALVLDQLHWGEFGHYCRRYPERAGTLQQRAVEKAVRACRHDWDVGAGAAHAVFATHQWLSRSEFPSGDDVEGALAYMGNWTSAEEEPLTFAATQQLNLSALPRRLPLILEISQAVERMAHEIFAPYRRHGRSSWKYTAA